MRPASKRRQGRRDLALVGGGAVAGLLGAALIAAITEIRLGSRLDEIEALRPPVVVIDMERLSSARDSETAARLLAAGQAAGKLSAAGYLVLAGSSVIAAPTDIYVGDALLASPGEEASHVAKP